MLHNYAAMMAWHAVQCCRVWQTCDTRGDSTLVDAAYFDELSHDLTKLDDAAKSVDLDLTRDQVALIRFRWSAGGLTFGDLRWLVNDLRQRMQDELERRQFFYVQELDANSYASPLSGWEKTIASMPSEQAEVEFDITEATRCLALDRSTAAVFHLMRLLELGLRRNGRRLRVTIPKGKPLHLANWEDILQAFDTRINTIRQPKKRPKRQPLKEPKLRYYTALRLDFAAFKDAWRNHVTHARDPYDESQALSVYRHVNSFLNQLADGPPR